MSDGGRILDFDAAYSNSGAVPGSAGYAERWAGEAQAFRAALAPSGRAELDHPYGEAGRQRYDLFRPESEARGLAVFIHGGYWKAFDKSLWSHLAAGPLALGAAVAMPSYTLCPQARIGDIVREMARFLDTVADAVPDVPIRLAGHSAGGHLASRLVCRDAPIAASTRARIASAVSISGVHDLRPIRRTAMNEILRIDEAEALAESPALLEPDTAIPVAAYVGAAELPEFRRQARFLASSWHGLGADVRLVEAEGRHHFDVVEDLALPASRLARLLTGAPAA